jgi:hypothetical protein
MPVPPIRIGIESSAGIAAALHSSHRLHVSELEMQPVNQCSATAALLPTSCSSAPCLKTRSLNRSPVPAPWAPASHRPTARVLPSLTRPSLPRRRLHRQRRPAPTGSQPQPLRLSPTSTPPLPPRQPHLPLTHLAPRLSLALIRPLVCPLKLESIRPLSPPPPPMRTL